MTSKLVVLKGSPKENGNSSTLANQAIQGAIDSGAEVEEFFLHTMDINACDACDFCKGLEGGNCIVEDDMQQIYPKLIAADAILLASPVYWFTISAQLKACIDRWYALEGPEGYLLAGKRFGLVLAYGDSDPFNSGAVNAIRTIQDMCSYLEADLVGVVYGSAPDPGDIKKLPETLQKAYELGGKLAVSEKGAN